MAYGKTPDKSLELKELLKKPGAPGGAWLLCGPEAYLSSFYLAQMRKKVIPDADMGFFDHIRLSGAETDTDGSTLGARLAAACEGLPVMNESKLIEIAEPGFSDMKAAELKEFCTALEALPDYPYVTVVTLCAEEEFNTTDYRAQSGTVWKALEKAGMHIVPFPYQDKGKLRTWGAKHFASDGIDAAPYLIDKMIDRVGTSMTALAGEMQKLCCYLHANGRGALVEADIPLVCTVTENAEDFGIQTAVRNRDIRALVTQYRILKAERAEPMQLFFSISSAIGDLWRVKTGLAEGYTREELMRIYKMKDYPMRLAVQGCGNYTLATLERLQKLCAETDVKLKSSSVDGYVLIERLICAMTKLYDAELELHGGNETGSRGTVTS